MTLQTATSLAPHQQYAALHRTVSGPMGDPRHPMLPSQGSYLEPEDSGEEHSGALTPEDAGQPGSAAVAAASVTGGDASRRASPSPRYSSRPRLEEENRFLLELRDRQRLPWREVTRRFEQRYNREYRMPTLQMRYGRLRQANQANRTRQWREEDTEALRQAWQWYMDERWRIISERVSIQSWRSFQALCMIFC